MSTRRKKLPGIVSFTAVLFTLTGFFHAIQGLGALIKKEYFDESTLAVVTFFTLGAYPVWSIVVIAVDILIIYGLTVHGDAFVPGGIEEGTVADPMREPPGRPFA